MCELPTSYLEWLTRECELKPKVAAVIERELDSRRRVLYANDSIFEVDDKTLLGLLAASGDDDELAGEVRAERSRRQRVRREILAVLDNMESIERSAGELDAELRAIIG